MCLGAIYAWSAFVPALKSAHGISGGQAGLVFGVTIAVFTTAAVFAGRLMERHGPSLVASIGAVLFGAGYLAASFSGGSFVLCWRAWGVLPDWGRLRLRLSPGNLRALVSAAQRVDHGRGGGRLRRRGHFAVGAGGPLAFGRHAGAGGLPSGWGHVRDGGAGGGAIAPPAGCGGRGALRLLPVRVLFASGSSGALAAGMFAGPRGLWWWGIRAAWAGPADCKPKAPFSTVSFRRGQRRRPDRVGMAV
jgi:hypothetical protein